MSSGDPLRPPARPVRLRPKPSKARPAEAACLSPTEPALNRANRLTDPSQDHVAHKKDRDAPDFDLGLVDDQGPAWRGRCQRPAAAVDGHRRVCRDAGPRQCRRDTNHDAFGSATASYLELLCGPFAVGRFGGQPFHGPPALLPAGRDPRTEQDRDRPQYAMPVDDPLGEKVDSAGRVDAESGLAVAGRASR